ncbi:MAG TPA: hypothetical protein VGR81_01820 [Candidatus Acidoferrales bacterium]|nr:hypothetical protein [Candidatus Acidoferrales bacterium]
MHKKIFVPAALLILASLLWAADEPWKTKPYQQWDKSDIQIILNDSPWAKKVQVDVNWKSNGSSPAVMAQSDQNVELRSHMNTQKGGMPDTAPPDRSMDSVGSTNNSSNAVSPKTSFYIRWYSSRVIREALAREAVLGGKITEAEGAKLLSEPVTDYEIIVFGPDMTPFQNLNEDQLKSDSYLEGKESKQKVVPATIRLNKNPAGITYSLVFLFPRKTAGGADVASAQEKGIEFVCKLKGLNLHNVFDTRKMVDEKGEDF